jgi:hypothetical protein
LSRLRHLELQQNPRAYIYGEPSHATAQMLNLGTMKVSMLLELAIFTRNKWALTFHDLKSNIKY